MARKVAIIGAGRFGSAIARLVKRSGAKVELWDQDASRVNGQKAFSAVLAPADTVFLCVPSFALEEVLKKARPLLRRGCVVVSPIKGIDRKTGKTTFDTMTGLLPARPFAILGGPMLAEELDKGLGGTAVIASRDARVARKVGALFAGSKVNIVYSGDVRGVACVGVLKNAYAVSMGVAEGLGWGMNLKGSLASRAVLEMRSVLSMLGGEAETACGPAGLGDFVATGFSRDSMNHRVGVAIAKGKIPGFKGEGGMSLPSLLSLLKRKKKNLADFPLLAATARVVAGKATAQKAFRKFQANGRA